jgi:hypothetical protein
MRFRTIPKSHLIVMFFLCAGRCASMELPSRLLAEMRAAKPN